MRAAVSYTLNDWLDSDWPPMSHVRRGAGALGSSGFALVEERLRSVLAGVDLPREKEPALRRFFSFLAQVEVIAIEVPLSALPTASPALRPLLERQLADEVFHATLFASLARRCGGPDEPLPEAEEVLREIRTQADPKTTAVLLNLIAEGWIENLFDEAVRWGVADSVFRIVLDDEARHVEEAHEHANGMDRARTADAVRRFEGSLFRLVQHPRVILPILALAGPERFSELGNSLMEAHRGALAEVGLAPADEVQEFAKAAAELRRNTPEPHATRIEPETQWRRTALELWDVPRHPVMHGWFEARVDHFPLGLTTAIMVAAVGQVWAEYPRINRFAHAGAAWAPDGANVGVRVALGEKGEALGTIVIPRANERSVGDIQRFITIGTKRLNELGGRGAEGAETAPAVQAPAGDLSGILRDEELMAMIPPESVSCAVTVSNVGRAGLAAGFGAMPGAMGQSVEFIIGQAEDRPVWRGWRYKPTPSVVVGCSADHRVIDGPHAAEAMRRLRSALSKEGVREIMGRPDTVQSDEQVRQMTDGHAAALILFACKAPWWLGWLCWLQKK
ncbi:MAG: 2-oxo acid dehydrogenase subunit E2 [Thermoplasmatota archaeon]